MHFVLIAFLLLASSCSLLLAFLFDQSTHILSSLLSNPLLVSPHSQLQSYPRSYPLPSSCSCPLFAPLVSSPHSQLQYSLLQSIVAVDWFPTHVTHQVGGLDHGCKAPCFVRSLASYFLFFDRSRPTIFLPNIPQRKYSLHPIIFTWSHSSLFEVWDHILSICLQLLCRGTILGRNLGCLLFIIDSNWPFNCGKSHKTLRCCPSCRAN